MIKISEIPIGLQIIDAEMKYVYLNDILLRQMDKSLEDHIGKKMNDVYPGIEASEVFTVIQECHATGKPQVVHNEFILPDGSLSFWELDFKKIDNQVVIFSRDITDTKQGEKLLLQSNIRLEKEVKKRTKELNVSNIKFKRLLKELSHDIRGPLTSISFLMEMIDMDDISKTDFNTIHTITKERIQNLNDLLNRILDDSMTETDNIHLEKGEHDLHEVFQKRFIALHKIGEFNAYEVHIEADENVIRNFDKVRIIQVIDNLLTNAIKYSKPQSTIHIRLSADGVFSIKNETDHNKVKQAKGAMDVKVSAGLGQEIVAFILKGHGSKLEIVKDDMHYEARFRLP